MTIKLIPLPFFIGIAFGLVSLSCVGSVVQSANLVNQFVRFHQFINVEAGYFPTARQVRAIVDKTDHNDQLIYVIVGGSSVLHGTGQHESLVWTRSLKERLGARFRVINLAQRGGDASDFGNIAAEYLLGSSKRVIFVADAPRKPRPLAASFYRHLIFGAWQRDFLRPWPLRDKLLAEAPLRGAEPLRGPALGAMLDTHLNFNDLWNFIVFDYMGLNWNRLLVERSFEARSRFKDTDLLPEQYRSLRYRDNLELIMGQVRSQILAPGDPAWQYAIDMTEQMIPPQLRAISLIVVDLESPYYVRRLAAAEHEKYLQAAHYHAKILAGLGFKRVLIPSEGFSDDDYNDRVHLSVSGGQKLAAAVAPAIQQMAIDLGYLK
jgi:hypothetical protein